MRRITDFLKAKKRVEVARLKLVTLQRNIYLATLSGAHKGTAYIFLTKEPPAAIIWEVLTAICEHEAVQEDRNVAFIPAYADAAAPAFSWDDDIDGKKLSIIQKYVTAAIVEHDAHNEDYDSAWAQNSKQTGTMLAGLLIEPVHPAPEAGKVCSHLALSPADRARLSALVAPKIPSAICVIGHVPSAADFISGFQDMSAMADSILNRGESYKLGKYDDQAFPDEKHRAYVIPVAMRFHIPRMLNAKAYVARTHEKLQNALLTGAETAEILKACGLDAEDFDIHKRHICSLHEICAKTILTWADLAKFKKKELSDAVRTVELP